MDVFARAERSRILTHVPLGKCVIANLTGDAVAAVTPGRAGGEPVRFIAFKRAGASAPTIVSAMATEYVMDAMVLGLGAVLLTIVAARQVDVLGRAVGWMASPRTWLIVSIALGLLFAAFAVLYRLHPHHAGRLLDTFRSAWHEFRHHTPTELLMITVWTVGSFASRAAILPVLLSDVPGIPLASLVLGGAAVFYLFLLSPTPGGIAVVDIGFIAGLGGTFSSADLARLILLWRLYAFALGAIIGAAILVHNRLRTGRSGRRVVAPIEEHAGSRSPG